jgi:exodeoxyribonuclease III
MRILSWNVNGLRAVVRNGFLGWLEQAQPDVLCLQETRVHPGELDLAIREPKGYRSFWQPALKKGYSGTATYTKVDPLAVETMNVPEFDVEGRVQVLRFKKFAVVNAYFPNSQPERARIDYKLAFCGAILDLCTTIRARGQHVILCGDYNIAHTEIDLARPKENEDNPGFLPEERTAMDRLLAAGYVDTFRHFHKEPGQYTWWSYRFNAREKNIGWRLDYHCVNHEFMAQVKDAAILADVTGSDHCPVALHIR